MATAATDVPGSKDATEPLVLEAEVILQELTTRQHLSPHKALWLALSQTRACPVAAERAVEWLGLDPTVAIGRLKRAELIQLARSLHRFWKRAVAATDVK